MPTGECPGFRCMGCALCRSQQGGESFSEGVSDHRSGGGHRTRRSIRKPSASKNSSSSEAADTLDRPRRRKKSRANGASALANSERREEEGDTDRAGPSVKRRRQSDPDMDTNDSHPLTSTGIGLGIPVSPNEVFQGEGEQAGAAGEFSFINLASTLEVTEVASPPSTFEDLPYILQPGEGRQPVLLPRPVPPPLPPSPPPTSGSQGVSPELPRGPPGSPALAGPSSSAGSEDSLVSLPHGEYAREEMSSSDEEEAFVISGSETHWKEGWVGCGVGPGLEELDWSLMGRATKAWDNYRANHPVLPLPPPHRFSPVLFCADWDPDNYNELWSQWEGVIYPGQRLVISQTHSVLGKCTSSGMTEKWLCWQREIEKPERVLISDLIRLRRERGDNGMTEDDPVVSQFRLYKTWAAGQTVCNSVFAGPKLRNADRYYFQQWEDANSEIQGTISRIRLGLRVVGERVEPRVAVESSPSEEEAGDGGRCPADLGPVRGSPAGGGRLLSSPASRGSWVADTNGGGRVRRGAGRSRLLVRNVYISDGFSELSPDCLVENSEDDRVFWQTVDRRQKIRSRTRSSGANNLGARLVPLVSSEEGDRLPGQRLPGRGRALPPPVPLSALDCPWKGNVTSGCIPLHGRLPTPRRKLFEKAETEEEGSAAAAEVPVAATESAGAAAAAVDEVDSSPGQEQQGGDGGDKRNEADEVSEISQAAHSLSLSAAAARKREGLLQGAVPKLKPCVTFRLPSASVSPGASNNKRQAPPPSNISKKSVANNNTAKKKKSGQPSQGAGAASLPANSSNSRTTPDFTVSGVKTGIANTIVEHNLLLTILENAASTFETVGEVKREQFSRVCASFCSLAVTLQEAKEHDRTLQMNDQVEISPLLKASLRVVQYEQAEVDLSLLLQKVVKGSLQRPDLKYFDTDEGRLLYAQWLSTADPRLIERLGCVSPALMEAYVLLWGRAEEFDCLGEDRQQQRTIRAILGLELVMQFFRSSPEAFSFLVAYYAMRVRESILASVDDTINMSLGPGGMKADDTFSASPGRARSVLPRQLGPESNYKLMKGRLLAKVQETGVSMASSIKESCRLVEQAADKLESVDQKLRLLLGEENALSNTLSNLRESRRDFDLGFANEVLQARREAGVPMMSDWGPAFSRARSMLRELSGAGWREAEQFPTDEEGTGGSDETDGRMLSKLLHPKDNGRQHLLEENGIVNEGFEAELTNRPGEPKTNSELPDITTSGLNERWAATDPDSSAVRPRPSPASPARPPASSPPASLLDSGLASGGATRPSLQPDRSPSSLVAVQQVNAEVWQQTGAGTYCRNLMAKHLDDLRDSSQEEKDNDSSKNDKRRLGEN